MQIGENMRDIQQSSQQLKRTVLRLSEVERLIRQHRIVVPAPSRGTLRNLCEDGTFETVGGQASSLGWLVFEDSFWAWAQNLGGNDR